MKYFRTFVTGAFMLSCCCLAALFPGCADDPGSATERAKASDLGFQQEVRQRGGFAQDIAEEEAEYNASLQGQSPAQ